MGFRLIPKSVTYDLERRNGPYFALWDALRKSVRVRCYRRKFTFAISSPDELVHGQVTIIFVVSVCLSVCLFVCLCRVFLSRL